MDETGKMERRREFGARVAAMRRAKGLSQERLALDAGLDRSYCGRVERGEQSISLDKIWALADALDTTPAAFFDNGQ